MKKILIIVPSRSAQGKRIKNIEDLKESWQLTTSGFSDLLIGLDDDDEHNYPRLENVLYEVNKRLRMVGTLNLLAAKYCNSYEYIMFLGDDHRLKTKGWEEIFLNDSKNLKNSIFYGNDLLQGINIPTAVFLDSNIVKKIGFMAPPCLVHMYADNFWLELGKSLNTIKYYEHVIIEHVHPVTKKTTFDNQYLEVDSYTAIDRLSFENYLKNDFQKDLERLKNV